MMAPSLPTRKQEKTGRFVWLSSVRLILALTTLECYLPTVKWFNVEGFTVDDLNFLTEIVRSNAPLIFELAERQKAGPAVSALAP